MGVNTHISENSKDTDVVIYMNASVVHHKQSIRAFMACSSGRVVQNSSGAYAVMTSSIIMEIKAVVKAFIWLESKDYTYDCVL